MARGIDCQRAAAQSLEAEGGEPRLDTRGVIAQNVDATQSLHHSHIRSNHCLHCHAQILKKGKQESGEGIARGRRRRRRCRWYRHVSTEVAEDSDRASAAVPVRAVNGQILHWSAEHLKRGARG